MLIGGGLASASLLMHLKNKNYDGEITIVSEDDAIPYDRPCLSKEFLKGEIDSPPKLVDEGLIKNSQVNYLAGKKAEHLDLTQKTLRLSDGQVLEFTELVLATGQHPRRITVEGSNLPNIYYLRKIEDAEKIKEKISQSRSIAIVGGGLIGCEVASVAQGMGLSVTVIESQGEFLNVLGTKVGRWLRDLLIHKGVRVFLNTKIHAFNGEKQVEEISTSQGSIRTDMVLVAIGSIPADELAKEAGIECQNGVIVDACGKTSANDVYAVGDVANWPLRDGGRRPLGTFINTQQEAEAVAYSLLGTPKPMPQVPKFWTNIENQFVQVTGDINGEGEYWERGELKPGLPYMLFRVKEGLPRAVLAVNSPKEYSVASRLVDNLIPVKKELIEDEKSNLRELLKKA